MERPLTPDEAALWARVLATVRPMRAAAAKSPAVAVPPAKGEGKVHHAVGLVLPPVVAAKTRPSPARTRATNAVPKTAVSKEGATLDGSWDKQLARGSVSPDCTIDLHGHNLGSAYALLDTALARAVANGDRVVLLITGKPPRPTSERPHQRGAIRAAIGDWLAGSRHAAGIAAIRGAHPRHGGAGALYIVLRRPRIGPKS